MDTPTPAVSESDAPRNLQSSSRTDAHAPTPPESPSFSQLGEASRRDPCLRQAGFVAKCAPQDDNQTPTPKCEPATAARHRAPIYLYLSGYRCVARAQPFLRQGEQTAPLRMNNPTLRKYGEGWATRERPQSRWETRRLRYRGPLKARPHQRLTPSLQRHFVL